MKKDYRVYLDDIVKSCDLIARYINGRSKEDLAKETELLDAVTRRLEIIGEAMNRLLKKDKTIIITNSRKIVDTRNRIIHGYDSLSDDFIWSIIVNHLPPLKKEIESLLNN